MTTLLLVVSGFVVFVSALVYQLTVRMTTGHETQDGSPIVPDIDWPLRIALGLIVAGVFNAIISP